MDKKCLICEKPSKNKYCKADHTKECVVCTKEFVVKDPYKYFKAKSCSPSCRSRLSHSIESQKKREENSLKRYGVKRPQQQELVKAKAKQTNQERYNADFPNQNGEVREKGYATNLEKFGVKHPLQNPAILDKAKKTLEDNFGVRHPSESPELRKKLGEVMREKYGAPHSWQSEEIKENIRKHYEDLYGVSYPSQVPEIREKVLKTIEEKINRGELPSYSRISKINRKWADYIKDTYATEVTFEKTLGTKSFDLYIEKINLLIDINPTVSHNVEIAFPCIINSCPLPCNQHVTLANSYHYERAKSAQENHFNLYQIYDWDSDDAVKKFLASKLEQNWIKHSARKLTVEKISQNTANLFLTEHHSQAGARGQTFCYGLKTLAGELLAVATFGSSRFKNKSEFEWIRYAVKRGHIIHGGSNMLWKAFVAETKPSSVISYVNFDHTTAEKTFMNACGFEEITQTGASLVWSKKAERIYNNSVLSLGADRLLKTNYGSVKESGLRNNDIMLLEGWLPVYTAGNRVFLYSAK